MDIHRVASGSSYTNVGVLQVKELFPERSLVKGVKFLSFALFCRRAYLSIILVIYLTATL